MMDTKNKTYPVNIRGELTVPPGPGWWLLKWLLVIPHLVVLCFLWVGFVIACIIAFFNILFTGKYPKSLFDFNTGVLRWTWRVGFYSYGVLGTDRYPPFSLDSDPNYPADLEIAYPEKLSSGLVLVKWWLLAIPHWIIVGFFIGGWSWSVDSGNRILTIQGGLIFVLAIFAGIVLLFTGKYPPSFLKLLTGMNRWAVRFIAYVSLMTDEYPPFRLWDDYS